MTTIIIDCKRKQVGSDSQATSYDISDKGEEYSQTQRYSHNTTKVHVDEDDRGKVIIAGTGNLNAIMYEVANYNSYGKFRNKPTGNWTIALVQGKGDAVHVDIHKSEEYKTFWGKKKYKVTTEHILSDTQYICLGSGSQYAYAAMMSGMCAYDAILLTAKCDIYTDHHPQIVNIIGD